MKRINTTKLMALLASLCLITSSFVGSTLAKYTTQASGADSARVAKFGVTITANGSTFAKEYETDDDAVSGTIAKSVISSDTGVNVLAPGTEGDMVAMTIAGTPEVAVNVNYAASLDLDGWNVDGAYYCPLEITVGSTTFKGLDYDNAAAFESAVEGAINGYSANYAPNQDLSDAAVKTPVVSWAWVFEGNDDVKDTKLGDASAASNAATVILAVTTTVTQLD